MHTTSLLCYAYLAPSYLHAFTQTCMLSLILGPQVPAFSCFPGISGCPFSTSSSIGAQELLPIPSTAIGPGLGACNQLGASCRLQYRTCKTVQYLQTSRYRGVDLSRKNKNTHRPLTSMSMRQPGVYLSRSPQQPQANVYPCEYMDIFVLFLLI